MIKRISDAEYFAIDAVNNSILSRLEQCPAATRLQVEQTQQMLLGSLAHCLVLEGREEFEKRYVVLPSIDRRTKEGKAIYETIVGNNQGKTVITLEQLQACVGMAESVAAHPACRELLADGEPEQCITWEEEGMPCKAKADWLSSTALIDLKTTTNSSYPVFSKTIFNRGYHRQMAFYLNGLKQNGVFTEAIVIIAVESEPPYTVNVYQLDDDVIECGTGLYLNLLRKWKSIKDLPEMPAYTYAGIHSVRLPQWMREAMD